MSAPRQSKKAVTVTSVDDILEDEVVKKPSSTQKPKAIEEISIDDINLDMYDSDI
jgi:hypothetical protein